jgi:molecular chaperone Hsp31 and glyoxalase 3
VTICHGPQGLRCADAETFAGYELVAYPDSADKGANVTVGYLPGRLLDVMGEGLKAKFAGIKLLNTAADDSTHVYKELISGASPLAAHALGLLMVKELARREAEKE